MNTTKIIFMTFLISICFFSNRVDAQLIEISKSKIKFINSPNKIDNKYIVVYQDSLVNQAQNSSPNKSLADISLEFTIDMANNSQSIIIKNYNNIFGSVFHNLNRKKVHMLLRDIRVKNIYAVTTVDLSGIQYNPEWGLDRIDQTDSLLNDIYEYSNDGTGVDVYVMDSGINSDHPEFFGRNIPEYYAYIDLGGPFCSACGPNNDGGDVILPGSDSVGHGTKVAGIIGGATYGVVKNVNLHSIKVFGNSESTNSASILDGLTWLNAKLNSNIGYPPTVLNMSIGWKVRHDDIEAVEMPDELYEMLQVLHDDNGVTLVGAAGNDGLIACSEPSRSPFVIAVGASNLYDDQAHFTNYGSCLDIFAPGEDITTAAGLNDGFDTVEGTSFAAPFVAGAVAMYLHDNPNATPIEVKAALINSASNIDIADAGSPDLLLNVANMFPDIYENDDSVNTATVLTDGVQIHNFFDDNNDLFILDLPKDYCTNSFEIASCNITVEVLGDPDHELFYNLCASSFVPNHNSPFQTYSTGCVINTHPTEIGINSPFSSTSLTLFENDNYNLINLYDLENDTLTTTNINRSYKTTVECLCD